MDNLLKRAMPSNSKMEEVLSATGDLAFAAGLECAAKVMRAMADEPESLTPKEVREAATALENSAEKRRKRGQAILAKY